MKWAWRFIIVLGVLASGAGPAAAQLIGELVQPQQVRKVATSGTADLFARWVGADADQREAAEAIVAGARSAVQREVNRHLRTIRSGVGTADAGDESQAAMAREVLAIERGMMDDLKALTTTQQADGFAKFERVRRVQVLLSVYDSGACSLDLRMELERLKVNVGSIEGLAEALERGEQEVEGGLIAYARATMDAIGFVRERVDDRARETETRNNRNASYARLQRAQVGAWQRVVALVDEKTRAALVQRRVERWFAQFDDGQGRLVFGDDTLPGTVREVQALDLSDAQREQVASRVARFEREYGALCRSWTAKMDEFVLGKGESVQNDLFEPREKLRKGLEADVLAMLTDEQRREYDVSPLLEKDSTWDVADELPATDK
jgi:hypothetical protein